jgi:hypothetical protein
VRCVAGAIARGIAICASVLLGSCGGGGNATAPTASGTPAPNVLPAGSVATVSSGETGAAVSGARVNVAGRTYTTDDRGQMRLESDVALDSPMTVAHAEFIERQTFLGKHLQFPLWPRRSPSGMDEALIREMVYVFFNSQAMIRLDSSITRVTVVPSAEIAANPELMKAHIEAAAAVTAAVDGRIGFSVDPAGTAGTIVTSALDSSIDSASAVRAMDGMNVVGGKLLFKGFSNARLRGVIVHELGHIFGFVHSASEEDIMGPGPGLRQDFSPREKVMMRLMLQRRAGNRYPDSDQSLGPGASARHTSPIGMVRIDCAVSVAEGR